MAFILGMYLLAQAAAVLLVMLVIVLRLPVHQRDADTVTSMMQSSGMIPGTIAALLLGGVVAWHLTRRSFPPGTGNEWLSSIGWTPSSWRDIAAGAALGVVTAVIYLYVGGSFFPPTENVEPGPLVSAALTSNWAQAGWAVAAIFLAPPIEEFLFRGVLLRGFTLSWSPLIASLLTITIFTALHYTETSDYFPGLVAIACLAVGATFARLVTGSLKPAIAIHAGYNLAMVLLLFFASE